jgi:hypothetical protein
MSANNLAFAKPISLHHIFYGFKTSRLEHVKAKGERRKEPLALMFESRVLRLNGDQYRVFSVHRKTNVMISRTEAK